MMLAGTCGYIMPPLYRCVGDRPANLAVENRGMPAILAACSDPAAALDAITDECGYTLGNPLDAFN